jgi:hypothetical protein
MEGRVCVCGREDNDDNGGDNDRLTRDNATVTQSRQRRRQWKGQRQWRRVKKTTIN